MSHTHEAQPTGLRAVRMVLAPLVAALVLAGCATAPSGLPTLDTPARFKELKEQPAQATQPSREGHWTRAEPAEAQPRGEWWRAFNDPVLDELIQRATRDVGGDGRIEQAAARVRQARALARLSDADRAPQLGLGAGAARQRGLDRNQKLEPGSLFNLGLNASWELDLFGRLARASEAASLDAAQREALLQSTRLLVQAEVAQTYLALRAADAERELVRDGVSAYRDTLRLTQRRQQAGDVAELDVARVQTEVSGNESQAYALDRHRAELEHALAVLTGEPPASFDIQPQAWNPALPVIPAGVPATVLTRRADVAAAQSAVLAAQARVGAAQAAYFPDISLTAGGGFASPAIGDLFKWSLRSWGIGALLSLPLFDGGRREAGVQNASAQLDEVLAGYRTQVLTAFREVEDQLSALRLLREQAAVQQTAVDSALRATQLSDIRYRNGYISQLDLLDARRTELSNRRQALQVKAAQYQATVGLVRALGGGWGEPERALAAAEPVKGAR